jgi:UDP-N-acetyl-D-glucosamine dehydrogenase
VRPPQHAGDTAEMAPLPQAAGELMERIERRLALVGIVGLGYVGLPLAVAFARRGFRVIGFDVAAAVVDGINAGRSHIGDVPSPVLGELVESGLIRATADAAELTHADAISICVPTPLSKTRDPDMGHVIAATETVAAALRPGQLVVLESTTYPGTTRELMLPMLQRSGLRAGLDFFLCFSPERVDPGNAVWRTENTPKVLGGLTPVCLAVGAALYGQVMDRVVPVSSPEAAELTKLLENTFRAVNIALVNEVAQACDRLGIDVWEVIEAAATKPFGFMKFTPGPGIGGHCIPLDPHYLAWKMKTLNFRTRLIDLAGEINSEMPLFVTRKVQDALNRAGRAVNGSSVLVLGAAYKKDIDDVRESPALDILRLLAERGARVSYHDPHVPRIRMNGGHIESVPLTPEALAAADCVVIATDHTAVDHAAVAAAARLVVDTRNAAPPGARVVGLSGPAAAPQGGPLPGGLPAALVPPSEEVHVYI